MKISVNDVELFTLSEIQKNVIKDEISNELFDSDMKRRLQWILMEKYNTCFQNLQNYWLPILISRGVTSIPTDKDAFAQLVFSQPDYKNRSQRDAEQI